MTPGNFTIIGGGLVGLATAWQLQRRHPEVRVVVIEKESSNGDVVARSRFHMMELRRDDVRHFAGSYTHHLKRTKDGYRIKLQRVDMTNAQAAYDYVLQVWV